MNFNRAAMNPVMSFIKSSLVIVILLLVVNFVVLGYSVYKIFQGRIVAESVQQEYLTHQAYGDTLDPSVEYIGGYYWGEQSAIQDVPVEFIGNHRSPQRDTLIRQLDEWWTVIMGVYDIE